MQQLIMFDDPEEMKRDLTETKEQLANVRRGLFQRYHKLDKEILNIKEDIGKILRLIE